MYLHRHMRGFIFVGGYAAAVAGLTSADGLYALVHAETFKADELQFGRCCRPRLRNGCVVTVLWRCSVPATVFVQVVICGCCWCRGAGLWRVVPVIGNCCNRGWLLIDS